MSLSEPFIRRPVGTSLLAIGLFVLGVFAYSQLPVAPMPRVDMPVVQVTAILPGADPATVASSLAAPLERRLGQIAGVTEMTSISTLGNANITVQFDLTRKPDSAARDVQAAINASSADLPINLPGPPTYKRVNPADSPVMILAMTSETLSPIEIYEYGNNIVGQKLSQVPGVSQALIAGGDKAAIRVQINPAALAGTGMSLEQVRALLGQVNVDEPKGSFDGGRTSYTITGNDQIFSPADYEHLILTQKKGTPVRIDSLGHAVLGVENSNSGAWADTNRAVLVIVFKQSTANVIETVERIKKVMPEIQRWLPPSIKFGLVSDRTQTIRASVEDVQISLATSVALVVMVIFLFLRRFWPTFIASITVPLALAGTFAFMRLFEFSLDNLSLMALTISVGFVVDDAIVVIENVYRFMEQGEPAMAAALKGARQIGFTVVSMSLSLVAVFIPLLFMGGMVGRIFHEFAVTLSVAVLVSGVISLTLTPMLCSRFLRSEASYGPPNLIYRVSERGFNLMLGVYETGLRWVLRHQYLTLFVAGLTMAATIWLYNIVPKGLLPMQDTGVVMGVADASQDISFAAMAELQKKMTKIVLEDEDVETLGSFIGAGMAGSTVNNGRLFITLKPHDKRKASAEQIIARLRPKLGKIPGVSLILQPAQDVRVGGRATKAQFQYALQASDLDDLNSWSAQLLAKLRANPKLRDVNTDQQTRGLSANVIVDRDAAARLGLTPAVIDNTLYDAFGQRQVSTVYRRFNQHHIILEVDPKYSLDPSSLQKLYVASTNGQQVPLSSVAKFVSGNAFLSVNHQGQFPAVTLSFNLAPGVSLGEATEIVNEITEELHMPSNVQGSFQGTAQVFQSSLSSTPILLAAALIAVYVVLGMLYESLIHPITILSTLPSAGVGALLALMVCGTDLSLVSFIGIILLMGIVKKNAIMMIDFALDAERQEGLTPEEAIYKACIIRFRPIMMTTMCALLGAVPLAIGLGTGSELRRPLGIAVVGGLVLSQVLTLYTTPVVYLAFEKLRLRFGHRRPARPVAPVPAPAGAV